MTIVNASRECLPREIHRETFNNGQPGLGLNLLGQFEERHVGKIRLLDSPGWGLKTETCFGVRRRWLGRRRRGGRSGRSRDKSTLASCLGLFFSAFPLGLVGLDLGFDAPLRLKILQLLLALFGSFLDLLLALEFFLQILRFLGGLLADFLEDISIQVIASC